MARLDISPEAERDLVDIGVYIARQSGSQPRADAFLDWIYQTCEMLATQPEMGEGVARSSPQASIAAFRSAAM